MSKNALRLNDIAQGTVPEHAGHFTPSPVHPVVTVTGKISAAANSVFINGKPAARMGDPVDEKDLCCGGRPGQIPAGSSSVFIEGKPAGRKKDQDLSHAGPMLQFKTYSPNVLIGG
jgi:uncharacterized Zn-binding protein involved in type VI secretion